MGCDCPARLPRASPARRRFGAPSRAPFDSRKGQIVGVFNSPFRGILFGGLLVEASPRLLGRVR